MQRKSVSRMWMATTIICVLLASGASAIAQANGEHCSNRTVFGNYGYSAEGVLLPAPSVTLQFRSMGVAHFDGNGNLSWVEHTVVNGMSLQPGFIAASGTYTVNPDCTGTAVVNTPNSPVPLNFALVVVRHGTEVHTILDTDAVSAVFIKVE
jgi:hypothetical protein